MVRIYDTLSEEKVELKKTTKPVKMFVCGPTVYDYAHLGHARTEISFDNIVRYLESIGYQIFYLQNITDVDDKIINRAVDEKTTPQQLAKKFEKEYLQDIKTIKITTIKRRARASDFIKEIQKQIQRMLDGNLAYQTASGIYFDVSKFKDYGKLSKQNLDELRPGWRIEPDPQKKDPIDFALWKLSSSQDDNIVWDSSWGRGRPGWHIEDTAITEKILGPQYDIHGGGIDLKFPHHESEIAQQESISSKKPFVKIWMHSGLVMINGERMAKSLGNFVRIRDFLQKHSVNALRFIVASAHYRSPINYDNHLVEQAENALNALEDFMARLDLIKERGEAAETLNESLKSREKNFRESMNDDFNTAGAIASLFLVVNDYQEKIWRLNKSEAGAIKDWLIKKLDIFGIVFKKQAVPASIRMLVKKRELLRKDKKFNEADLSRDKIEALGYSIEDTPAGPLICKI